VRHIPLRRYTLTDLNTATRMISAELQRQIDDPVITKIVEYPVGWLFYWTTRRAYLSADIDDMIFGNGPLLVDKRNSIVVYFGTADPEKEVEGYVRKYSDNPPDSSGSLGLPMYNRLL